MYLHALAYALVLARALARIEILLRILWERFGKETGIGSGAGRARVQGRGGQRQGRRLSLLVKFSAKPIGIYFFSLPLSDILGHKIDFFFKKRKIDVYKLYLIMGKQNLNKFKILMEVIVNMVNVLRKLSFGCMLSALCVSLQATAFYGDDCCPTNPCCRPACCDGPLAANAFGIAVKGGVTPSWFTDRGHIFFINPLMTPIVTRGPREPDFDKLFDLPWQVGAELQWNACCNVQFFAEYVFLNAKGKKHHFHSDLFPSLRIHNRNRDFETNAVYLGARYYFGNLWCSECGTSSIAPFVGFKGGVVWHEKTRFRSRFLCNNDLIDIDCGNHDLFRNQTLISAGAQIGVDWSINCNWGVILTVEVVGTQALRNNRNIIIPPVIESEGLPLLPTNLSRGETGHILSVPVTLGFRYTF